MHRRIGNNAGAGLWDALNKKTADSHPIVEFGTCGTLYTKCWWETSICAQEWMSLARGSPFDLKGCQSRIGRQFAGAIDAKRFVMGGHGRD